ncbi:MAG: butyrate kinase [Spirochaetota bacterium]
MNEKILVINPGSTSSKIAVFNGEECIFTTNISHSIEELSKLQNYEDQYEFRKKLIKNELLKMDIAIDDIKVIVGRGGSLKPLPSGVYSINEAMRIDLKDGWEDSKHGANLAGFIVEEMSKEIPGSQGMVADPPVVDELDDVARLTGHPDFSKRTVFHALNQKAIARKHAKEKGLVYENLNLIVAHLGGGISIGAHRKGRIVDVNNCLDGDGPFSPERSGSLPVGDLAKLCFSGTVTYDEVRKKLVGQGGMIAYLGTNDVREVEQMISKGNKKAELVYEAMIYQVSKDIGAMFTVLKGEVDAILLTGGIVYSSKVVDRIRERTGKLAEIYIYPGEDEMGALAMNGLMVLRKEIQLKEY